jgi:hypothetical protein
MGTVSKNFSYREFEDSEIATENGIINVITTVSVRDSIKALVDNVLQPLRDKWGEPMVLNSGYRCPELNKAVKGELTSQHLKGEAADIRCNRPLELAQLAYDMGLPYDQMIIYPTFVHFSHKLEGEQRGQILYNKAYRGEKIKL